MVEFGGEGMVEIHRFRLTPDVLRTDVAKGLVINGTDTPQGCQLGTVGHQTFTKHKQGIIALGKGMAQIGTRSRTVIAIMHLTITEMHHEVVLVDHFESEDLGGCCRHGHH